MHREARRRRAYLRWLVPALLLVVWLGIAAVAGPMAGKISDVQKNDNASFLPAGAESTKALNLDKEFTGSDTVPAIVVWERSSGLTAADRAAVEAAARKTSGLEGVAGRPSPVVVSEDGRAAQLVVPLPGSDSFDVAGPVVD